MSTVTVTANEFNTIFIHDEAGNLIADSATFRRQRGFHNKVTGQWVSAKDFTPRKVRQCPERVRVYLDMTGTQTDARIYIGF